MNDTLSSLVLRKKQNKKLISEKKENAEMNAHKPTMKNKWKRTQFRYL